MIPKAATDPMTAPAMTPAWLLLETPPDVTPGGELLPGRDSGIDPLGVGRFESSLETELVIGCISVNL
jgi:hypothetical protein